jgi:hypothetical protein
MTQFEMSAGLNDSPKFISALGQLVREALGSEVQSYVPIHTNGGHTTSPELLAAAVD